MKLTYNKTDIPEIELEKLRLCDESPVGVSSDLVKGRFYFKDPAILTSDAIRLLLQVNPIFIIPIPDKYQKKDLYRVIFGRRLFELAAFSLNPTDKIFVNIVTSTLSNEDILHLKYLDRVVAPTISSLDVRCSEFYDIMTSDKILAKKTWLLKSKADFANAFGKSRSLLSQKQEEHGKKEQA